MRQLAQWYWAHKEREAYLFSLRDFRALFPEMSEAAFNTLMSRAVSSGYLRRICRGIYTYAESPPTGLELFHTAALLRANEFNYISLETALSDMGVISQVPLNWITIMTSGRSHQIDCGAYGTIEFIHTEQKPENINEHLHYDARCKLWRANITQALRDMRMARRDCNLIDEEIANELIRSTRR